MRPMPLEKSSWARKASERPEIEAVRMAKISMNLDLILGRLLRHGN